MAVEKEPPSDRTIEQNVPKLKEILESGMRVLDIGCGAGTITADVAVIVSPGEVVGLNTMKEDDQIAKQWAEDADVANNTSFVIGDSHFLEFEDCSFDIVYSYTAAHFFIDPVRALKEQARVTKKGGLVIAAGVRDIGPRYPRCVNWEKVWDAWIRFSDSLRDDYLHGNEDAASILQKHFEYSNDYVYHYDIQAGRKCAEWFSQSGLQDISIHAEVVGLRYPKDDLMAPKIIDLVDFADMSEEACEVLRGYHARMVEAGYVDDKTIDAARKEAEIWLDSPCAMNYWISTYASGRVR